MEYHRRDDGIGIVYIHGCNQLPGRSVPLLILASYHDIRLLRQLVCREQVHPSGMHGAVSAAYILLVFQRFSPFGMTDISDDINRL